MAQLNRKFEGRNADMVARETDLKALPFPALNGKRESTELPWWKRFLLKAGTLEMTQPQQQAPRLNSTVLALCSLILIFVGLMTGGAIQYGRLLGQVENLQADVVVLKQQRADDAKYLEAVIGELRSQIGEQPEPKKKGK